jgi:hypothetical protein
MPRAVMSLPLRGEDAKLQTTRRVIHLVVCYLNPQGKPAGLQSISNVRDSADVALLTPGDPNRFRFCSPGFWTEVQDISGQVF